LNKSGYVRVALQGNRINTRTGNYVLNLIISLVILCVCANAQTGEPTNAQQASQQQTEPGGITAEMQATEKARCAAMSPDELTWELTLKANLGNYYLPAYYRDKDAHRETAWDYVRDNPRLPRALIIGDSISRGYTVTVRHALAGKVDVHRAPANCGPTASGLKNLATWLGNGKWDVIAWNFGIHDRDTDLDVYKMNLETLRSRLEKTGARLIWVRTTPAPPSAANQERYTDVECQRVNQAADEVMKRHGIPEVDLYALLKDRLAELQLPNNVHFSEAGYKLMGSEVAAEILATMGGNR